MADWKRKKTGARTYHVRDIRHDCKSDAHWQFNEFYYRLHAKSENNHLTWIYLELAPGMHEYFFKDDKLDKVDFHRMGTRRLCSHMSVKKPEWGPMPRLDDVTKNYFLDIQKDNPELQPSLENCLKQISGPGPYTFDEKKKKVRALDYLNNTK